MPNSRSRQEKESGSGRDDGCRTRGRFWPVGVIDHCIGSINRRDYLSLHRIGRVMVKDTRLRTEMWGGVTLTLT